MTTIEPPLSEALPEDRLPATFGALDDVPAARERTDWFGGRYAAVVARVVELVRFGAVGGIAYVVNLGVFNLLAYGPGQILGAKPLTANVIGVALSTLVAWIGNRYWTFQGRRTETKTRELMGFAVVNIGGLLIGIGCLAFSHYVLNLQTQLADNISANGVGLVLGTAFRYVAYRRFVFVGDRD